MKLIIGYFALITLLLVSLSVFANLKASAEPEAEEAVPTAPIQKTSTLPAPASDTPIVESFVI